MTAQFLTRFSVTSLSGRSSANWISLTDFGCSGFQVEDLEPGLEQQTGVSSGWSDYGAFGTELWHGFHDLCCPPPIFFIWRTKKKQAVGISKFKTLKKTSTIK